MAAFQVTSEQEFATKCKNSAVSTYITNFLMLLEKFLGREPSVDVAIIIMKNSKVLEEFVFEIQYPKVQENSTDIPKFKIEDLLTSISHALNSVSSSKTPCDGNTFELQIRSDCSVVSLDDIEDHLKKENFPWTAVEDPDAEPWTKVIPLQTVDNPRFKVQIYQLQKES